MDTLAGAGAGAGGVGGGVEAAGEVEQAVGVGEPPWPWELNPKPPHLRFLTRARQIGLRFLLDGSTAPLLSCRGRRRGGRKEGTGKTQLYPMEKKCETRIGTTPESLHES